MVRVSHGVHEIIASLAQHVPDLSGYRFLTRPTSASSKSCAPFDLPEGWDALFIGCQDEFVIIAPIVQGHDSLRAEPHTSCICDDPGSITFTGKGYFRSSPWTADSLLRENDEPRVDSLFGQFEGERSQLVAVVCGAWHQQDGRRGKPRIESSLKAHRREFQPWSWRLHRLAVDFRRSWRTDRPPKTRNLRRRIASDLSGSSFSRIGVMGFNPSRNVDRPAMVPKHHLIQGSAYAVISSQSSWAASESSAAVAATYAVRRRSTRARDA